MPMLNDDKVVQLIAAAIVAGGMPESRVLIGGDRRPDDLPDEIDTPEHWVCISGLDLEEIDESGEDDPDAMKMTVRLVLFTVGPEASDQRTHYAVRTQVAEALKDKGLRDEGTSTTLNLDRASRRSLDVPGEAQLFVTSLITATGTAIAET